MPLWKLPRSSFSSGACAFSSGKPDAEEHARQAELLLERGHHGNRAAFTIEHRPLAEAMLDRTAGRLDIGIVERRHPGLAPVHARDRELHRLRRDLLDVGFEQITNLLGFLIRNEPHAHLRHGRGRNHGLGTFAGEAGKKPVHFERRPRPDAFEGGVASLAKQFWGAELLPILSLVEGKARELLRSSSVSGTTSS